MDKFKFNFKIKSNFSRFPKRGASLRNQAGFTLVELGVVLGVGAAVGLAALFIVPGMLANSNAKEFSDAVTSAVPRIQTAHKNRTSFNGLNTSVVANNGWIAENFIEKNTATGVPTGNLIAPWDGGAITFTTSAPFTQVVVSVAGVDKNTCNALVTTMMGNDLFIAGNVGTGTPVKASSATGVDLAVAGARCSAAGAKTVSFTFARN